MRPCNATIVDDPVKGGSQKYSLRAAAQFYLAARIESGGPTNLTVYSPGGSVINPSRTKDWYKLLTTEGDYTIEINSPGGGGAFRLALAFVSEQTIRMRSPGGRPVVVRGGRARGTSRAGREENNHGRGPRASQSA